MVRIGAAREFFEETGIDLRQSLDRIKSLRTFGIGSGSRFVFELLLTQEDSLDHEGDSIGEGHDHNQPVASSMPITGESFRLRLCSEHTGFCFVESLHHAANLTSQHSGGFSSSALLQYSEKLKTLGTMTLLSDSHRKSRPTSPRSLHDGEPHSTPNGDTPSLFEPTLTTNQLTSSFEQLSSCFRAIATFCSRLLGNH